MTRIPAPQSCVLSARLRSAAACRRSLRRDRFTFSTRWTSVWPGSTWCLSVCLQTLAAPDRCHSRPSSSLPTDGSEPSTLYQTVSQTREISQTHTQPSTQTSLTHCFCTCMCRERVLIAVLSGVMMILLLSTERCGSGSIRGIRIRSGRWRTFTSVQPVRTTVEVMETVWTSTACVTPGSRDPAATPAARWR